MKSFMDTVEEVSFCLVQVGTAVVLLIAIVLVCTVTFSLFISGETAVPKKEDVDVAIGPDYHIEAIVHNRQWLNDGSWSSSVKVQGEHFTITLMPNVGQSSHGEATEWVEKMTSKIITVFAPLSELADELGSNSSAGRREGSSPSGGTIDLNKPYPEGNSH